MAELMPERAIDEHFSEFSLEIDSNNFYRVVEYRRSDGTLYMESRLSHRMTDGLYSKMIWRFYDAEGESVLYERTWNLAYDHMKRVVFKDAENFKQSFEDPDSDGTYRAIVYTRKDGTTFMRSKLSRYDVVEKVYRELTWTFYDLDGIAEKSKKKWELFYDNNKQLQYKVALPV